MLKSFVIFAIGELVSILTFIAGHLYDNSHTTGPADVGDQIMLWSLLLAIVFMLPTAIFGIIALYRKIQK